MSVYRSYQEVVGFINLVKSRPALWDKSHHLYTDKRVCEALWEFIGEKCNITGRAAKSRWMNLQHNFRRDLRRSLVGCVGKKPEDYNSSWRYFQHMFFLKDQLKHKIITNPLYIQTRQNQLNLSPIPSTSKQCNNSMEEVEIEETTHNAFVKEFPKSHQANQIQSSENSFQRQVAETMLASIDPDLGFLAGLLPHLRAVPEQNKVHLKNRLLEVVIEYLSQPKTTDEIIILDDDSNSSSSDEREEVTRSPQPCSSNFRKRKLKFEDELSSKKAVTSGTH